MATQLIAPLYDNQQAALEEQLSIAAALRKQGMANDSGQGYQGGKVFMVGNPLRGMIQTGASELINKKARAGLEELTNKRRAEREQFVSNMLDDGGPATPQPTQQHALPKTVNAAAPSGMETFAVPSPGESAPVGVPTMAGEPLLMDGAPSAQQSVLPRATSASTSIPTATGDGVTVPDPTTPPSQTFAQEPPSRQSLLPQAVGGARALADRRRKLIASSVGMPGMEGIAGAAINQSMLAPEKQADREATLEAARLNTMAKLYESRGQRADALALRQQSLDIQRMLAASTIADRQGKRDLKADDAAKKESDAVAFNQSQITTIDDMIGKRDAAGNLLPGQQLKAGFNDFVGATWKPGARFIAGTDAATFQASHDQVASSARVEGIRMLRGSGSISNAEGAAAQQALTRISPNMKESEYIKAILEYRTALSRSVDRAARGVKIDRVTQKEIPAAEYDRKYGGGASQQSSAPTASAGAGLPSGVTAIRTGTRNGKRVVQGSDGKVYDVN